MKKENNDSTFESNNENQEITKHCIPETREERDAEGLKLFNIKVNPVL